MGCGNSSQARLLEHAKLPMRKLRREISAGKVKYKKALIENTIRVHRNDIKKLKCDRKHQKNRSPKIQAKLRQQIATLECEIQKLVIIVRWRTGFGL
jgi:hypothetical protein